MRIWNVCGSHWKQCKMQMRQSWKVGLICIWMLAKAKGRAMQACQTPGHMLEGESTEWKEKAIECGLLENVRIQGWADEEEPTEETEEVPPFISLGHSFGQQIFTGRLPWAGPGTKGMVGDHWCLPTEAQVMKMLIAKTRKVEYKSLMSLLLLLFCCCFFPILFLGTSDYS